MMSEIAQGMMPLSSYSNGRKNSDAVGRILRMAVVTAAACEFMWLTIAEIFSEIVVSAFTGEVSEQALHLLAVCAFRLCAMRHIGENLSTR
jgi:Na+-driven multidrug efflux pump